jgi:ABC-2 type transport system ATP-binding protein
MDEAERCHDIGYILHGRLIARGTASELISRSGLITLRGSGMDIERATEALAHAPGVLSASAFGTTVHISGVDRAALEAALSSWRQRGYSWEEVQPTLEDIFIQLMSKSVDKRYAA